MVVHPTEIPDVFLIQTQIHRDGRGFFRECFRADVFRELGLTAPCVQDNHSRSSPGVLRGLHYQRSPAQGKLVGVIRGAIWDVAVDLRPDSETFRQWYGAELSDVNGRMMWIPAGFAHGFCVLGEESADVVYKVDGRYNPAGELGVHWADADLAIRWPIASPIVSERDRKLPPLSKLDLESVWDDARLCFAVN